MQRHTPRALEGAQRLWCADRVCAREQLRQFVRLTISGAIMKDQAGADFVVSPCQFYPAEARKGMSSGKLRFSAFQAPRAERLASPHHG